MRLSRRNFFGYGLTLSAAARSGVPRDSQTGAQRLSLAKLRDWERWRYGMFIHFGMSTFLANEYPDGTAPATVYAPDRLDVDQWVQIVRDAGMQYAVLTAKHHAGHCLWPSRKTDYTVQNSGNKTDVIAAFVKACEKRGVLPGLYYAALEYHHLFGHPVKQPAGLELFTTSLYQDFMTDQLTELLTGYGPIAEVWIDIPRVMGLGYRTFLYGHLAGLQPGTVVVMNNGVHDGRAKRYDRSWPTDVITMEHMLPETTGWQKWRDIEGRRYYVPCEVCDTVGPHWFWMENDSPRPDSELADVFRQSRERGANLLLDVGPDKHGLIPEPFRDALFRLRKNVGL